MSVTLAAQPPGALFREEQWLSGWVLVTMALALAGFLTLISWWIGAHGGGPAGGGMSKTALVGLVLIYGLGLSIPIAGILKMTTEVDPLELRVWFGWFPTYRRRIALSTIRHVEVVRYRPWRDCGGFGIRLTTSGELVLNARGNQAVRVVLTDGSRLLIGSQRADDLARVLRQSRPPGLSA